MYQKLVSYFTSCITYFRHVFHKSCVDPWLLDQRSCPMCKLDILRAYGMQVNKIFMLFANFMLICGKYFFLFLHVEGNHKTSAKWFLLSLCKRMSSKEPERTVLFKNMQGKFFVKAKKIE